MVLVHRPSVSTSSGIVLGAILVSHLSATLAPSILSALSEAFVKICPDDALIEFGTANVLHAVERVLVGVVLNKTESAGSLLETVKPHDEPLDLATFAEQFVDLFFCCIEGEVAHVQRCRVFELVFGRWRASVEIFWVAVAIASAFLGYLVSGCAVRWH